MHLRAVGGVLCACDCGVWVLDAQYFDDAGDQPRVRIVVEADQHDVACGRICRRGGDHGGGACGGLTATDGLRRMDCDGWIATDGLRRIECGGLDCGVLAEGRK